MAISTNGTIIARLAGGLYNQTLSNASYNEMVGSVKSAADINTLANSLVATDFAGKTDAQIATVLLTNLNLTSVAGLNNWVAAQITAAGPAGKGAKIVSLLNDYSNLTADAVYGASASSFNGKVDAALALSQTAGFKGGDLNAAATTAASQTFTLTASAPSVTEADSATKVLTFTLTLDKAPATDLVINYAVDSTSTAKLGDDFTVTAGRVTFSAGQTIAEVQVNVLADDADEADETIVLNFTNTDRVSNLNSSTTIKRVNDLKATGTIVDDDFSFVFTSAAAVSVAENTTAVVTVAGADADSATGLTTTLTGPDAALFSVTNGALAFRAAPNFEAPADAGANNVYNVSVNVADASGNATTQNLVITVTNVNEAPVVSSAATGTVAENAAITTAVYTATASDVDAGDTRTFSLTGTDAASFAINAATGVVTLNASANFEVKTSYAINVVATDAAGLTSTQAVAVTVTNVNEAPVVTSGATATVVENAAISTVIYTATATDVDAGDTRTFSLTGTDAAAFDINASTGVVTLKASADFETKAAYAIDVVATDAGGLTSTQAVAVGVTNVAGTSFSLTTGVNTLTGDKEDDTFDARTMDSWTALDSIDGGLGTNDLLTVATTATVAPVGATVTGVEAITIATTGAGYTIDTSVAGTYTGLTSLSVADAAAGAVGITAATTTDVITTALGAVTIDGGKTIAASTTTGAVAIGGTTAPTGAITLAHSAQAASTISVLGGTSATVTTAQSVASAAAGGTVTVGSATKAPTGAVNVTSSLSSTNATNGTTSTAGAISVTGGSTVTVTQNIAVSAAAAATILTGSVAANATGGAIGVTGSSSTTTVTVNQTAAVTAVNSGTAGVGGIIDGAVTIADKNAASGTLAGTIATVSLTNFGNSTVDSSALTSVTLGGTGGTMGIGRGALTAVPTANTLALNTNTLTGTNTITDSEASADDGFTTINLTNTGTTVIADLVAADLTTLNIAGSGSLTLTANTLGGALTTTIVSTSTGSVKLSGALAVAANYTGAAGVDTVTLGTAATGTINTNAGNDVITVSTLGTAGRINAGDGTDTLVMAAADAATATAAATFAAKVTSVEQLSLGAYADAAGVTVNLLNLNNINHVTSAGAVASTGGARAQAISGFTTGGTFNQTALFNTAQNVTLSGPGFTAGTADTFNFGMTGTDGYANVGVLTLADIETLAITTTDSDTTAATTAFDANIDSTSVKTVTVTGNAGMTFANSDLGTALTSFNASGVTVGPVTYTTAALAAAATITGGAGADTLSGASAAVAGVTISGNGGADTITGSATKASTLNGDAGNDTITGGAAADVIDGGADTNTYVFSSANVVEQAGSGTTSGAVINLSANAITSTDIFTASGAFLTSLQTSIASGASTYLFNNESNTNVSVVDTLANINNVTGTDLADYIVGSATANVIIGGEGVDTITTGAGADTIQLAAIAVAGSVAGADKITDFTVGTGNDVVRALDSVYAWFNGTSDGVVVLATGATLNAAHAANNNFTVATISTNVTTHTVATYLSGASTITQLEGEISTALGAATDANFANTDFILVAIDDGASTMLVRVVSAANNDVIAAAELSLIGILQGVTDATTLTAGNFIFS